MQIQKWLAETTSLLEPENGTARLDAELLLCDELGVERSWLLAHPEDIITDEQLTKLEKKRARRMEHEPLAYIRGRAEFYGREFRINSQVLVPRPESETMIEQALAHRSLLASDHPPRIADVGSGSGALGISLALELGTELVDFYDIDPQTLSVARQNARMRTFRPQFYTSDLLEKCTTTYDVVLANLPYVPTAHTINSAAMREPALAIFGGADGLDLYRKLFAQLESFEWRPRLLLTEALPPSHAELAKIATKHGFKLKISQDFIQVFVPA